MLLMDLDHFKSINDRFGHALGDRVLEVFANTTRKALRKEDLFGRLGGEEFAAVLSAADRDEGLAIAQQVREFFAQAGAAGRRARHRRHSERRRLAL
jgi:diguanylate cyclase (GGDEF)-like protein